MTGIKVIFEDDEWIEYEITQPNNLLGDTSYWNDEDWTTWNEKMMKLQNEGTTGQDETFTVKFNKNPFKNGQQFLSATRIKRSDETIEDTDGEQTNGTEI